MGKKYDVLIVGGGPAGGTAAFFLRQAGLQVLVIEKDVLPRYKTCGGAISANVLQQFPFSFEPVIQSKVREISYTFGTKQVTIPLADSSLCMVMRDQFDAYLLEHSDAEIRQGTAVQAVEETQDNVAVRTTNEEWIEGDYLIAADGANSICARALNLRRKKVMAGAIEVEASVPDEILNNFKDRPALIFGEVETGYLWIFPKNGHLSVGIGGLGTRRGELQTVLEQVMKRFGIDVNSQMWTGHPLPLYSHRETLSTRRSLLVGDAAGLVDPFTGEGIRFAIKSGRLAAEAVLSGHPEHYSAAVEQEIGRNHRLGALLTEMFYQHPNIFFEFGLRNPALSYGLVNMIADRTGYAGLIWKIVSSLPHFLLSKKVPVEKIPASDTTI